MRRTETRNGGRSGEEEQVEGLIGRNSPRGLQPGAPRRLFGAGAEGANEARGVAVNLFGAGAEGANEARGVAVNLFGAGAEGANGARGVAVNLFGAGGERDAGNGVENAAGNAGRRVWVPPTPDELLKGFAVPLVDEVLELSPNFPAIRSKEEGCVKVNRNPFAGVVASLLVREPASPNALALCAALRAETPYDGEALALIAPPGVYTWLVYTSREGGPRRFVAKQALSMWELGTRHGALACDPDLRILPTAEEGPRGNVVGGGELEKSPDGSIRFNLLSGTFTKVMMDAFVHKTQRHIRAGYDYSENYTLAIVRVVEGLIHAPRPLVFVPTVVDGVQAGTFLTSKTVGPVSPEALARYRAHGFEIVSATEEECKACEVAEEEKQKRAVPPRAPRPPNSPAPAERKRSRRRSSRRQRRRSSCRSRR
jgi:hypothetical protein